MVTTDSNFTIKEPEEVHWTSDLEKWLVYVACDVCSTVYSASNRMPRTRAKAKRSRKASKLSVYGSGVCVSGGLIANFSSFSDCCIVGIFLMARFAYLLF